MILETYQVIKVKRPPFSQEDDRAVAEFRGFYEVGSYLAQKAEHPMAISVMLEVTKNLQKMLEKRL